MSLTLKESFLNSENTLQNVDDVIASNIASDLDSSTSFSLRIDPDNHITNFGPNHLAATKMTKPIKLNEFSTSNASLWFLSTEVIFERGQ